jgi:hypothetical protein
VPVFGKRFKLNPYAMCLGFVSMVVQSGGGLMTLCFAMFDSGREDGRTDHKKTLVTVPTYFCGPIGNGDIGIQSIDSSTDETEKHHSPIHHNSGLMANSTLMWNPATSLMVVSATCARSLLESRTGFCTPWI